MGYFDNGRWIEESPIPNREFFYELAAEVHKWGREHGYYIKMDPKGVSYEKDRSIQYGVYQIIEFHNIIHQ